MPTVHIACIQLASKPFDPATNLRLGIASLSRRIEKFGGNRILALAGYNAGDDKAKKWEKEFPGLETDEFIDQIPYSETRMYVKRILGSYEAYRWVYGPDTPGGSGEGN